MTTPKQTAALDAMADYARELGLTYDDVPLPEPWDVLDDELGNSLSVYLAAQLRDYGQQCAKAARLAALEEAAKVCEELGAFYYYDPGSSAAAAIRALAAAGVAK